MPKNSVFAAERQTTFRGITPPLQAFFDVPGGAMSEATERALKIRQSARIFEQLVHDQIDHGTWPLHAIHNGILLYWLQLGDEGAAASIAQEISNRLEIAPPLAGSTYVPYVMWHRTEAAKELLTKYEEVLLGMGALEDEVLYPVLECTGAKRALLTKYLNADEASDEEIPNRETINRYITDGNILRFLVHYVDLLIDKSIHDRTDKLYSLAALDVCPSSVAAQLSNISPARISQLVSRDTIEFLRPPGAREVFVSPREIQSYLSSVRGGGTRVRPPQTIRSTDGLVYHSVKAVSEIEEFDLTASWIAQLVRDKKVKGFRSQIAGKRVYVNLESLRNYLAVKAER